MLAEFLLPRIPVQIRVAGAADTPVLERSAGVSSPEEAQARLAEQERGEGLYLIACIAGTPVGDAHVTWAGVPTERPYPQIVHMSVFAGLEGYGIGTALLQSCEDACRERGYYRVGLVVDPVRESRERVLYERLGYRFAEAGNPQDDGHVGDDSEAGVSRSISLMKDLSQ